MKELHDFLSEIDQLEDEGQSALNKLLDSTSELKQLPVVARKVMKVIENPKSTAGDLERVLKADQALTVKILKIANSSFYGLLRKVNTLQRAILVIGFKAIKDIAVSSAILNMYRSSDPLSINLWEQAVGVGIGARLLSLEFENTDADEAFVSGLLHNLGMALLLKAKPDEFSKVFEAAAKTEKPDETLMALEKRVFGFAHTHAGGLLAKSWNLSESLEAVMRYCHYLPEILWTEVSLDVKTNIAIVSLARKYCNKLGIGFIANPDLNLAECPEAEFLRIPPERLEEMVEEIKLSYYSESQVFA